MPAPCFCRRRCETEKRDPQARGLPLSSFLSLARFSSPALDQALPGIRFHGSVPSARGTTSYDGERQVCVLRLFSFAWFFVYIYTTKNALLVYVHC